MDQDLKKRKKTPQDPAIGSQSTTQSFSLTIKGSGSQKISHSTSLGNPQQDYDLIKSSLKP